MKFLSNLADDVTLGFRRLRANLPRAGVAVSLLALAVGLATTMFSVVDALVLRPAPFPDAGRLVQQTVGHTEPDLLDAWSGSGMFEEVAATSSAFAEVEVGGTRKTLLDAAMTPNTFRLLNTRPLIGRLLGANSGSASGEVVLSESVWRRLFDADQDVVGRTFTVNGGLATVVGVVPRSFRFPGPEIEIWRHLDLSQQRATGFTLVGKLSQGVPISDVALRTQQMAKEFARLPRNYAGPPLLQLGHGRVDDATQRVVWLLFGAVGIVFLILCANVGSLLLTNLTLRRHEFALCTAIGASRGRLIRQAVVEHGFLGAGGAIAGVLLAGELTSLIPKLFVTRTMNAVDLDPLVLMCACAFGGLSVTVAGVFPAVWGTRADATELLRSSRAAGAETRLTRVITRGVVIGEIALACALLGTSTLLVLAFVRLTGFDRGLSVEGVTRIRVSGLAQAFPSSVGRTGALADIERRVRGMPEVAELALSQELPPMTGSSTERVHSGSGDAAAYPSDGYRVRPEFFGVYKIPLVRGRVFDHSAPPTEVVISERLASSLWPGQEPLGRTFAIGSLAGARVVVGVAREVNFPTARPDGDRPELYTNIQPDPRGISLSMRCRVACPAELIARGLADVHPRISVEVLPPAEVAYARELELPRATAAVAGVFGFVAIVTASGGLFSVITHAVKRRRREFGIRVSLGAAAPALQWLVLREAIVMGFCGLGIGSVAGWLAIRFLGSGQYGLNAPQLPVWSIVGVVVFLTTVAASWQPARAASRVNPVSLLREE